MGGEKASEVSAAFSVKSSRSSLAAHWVKKTREKGKGEKGG